MRPIKPVESRDEAGLCQALDVGERGKRGEAFIIKLLESRQIPGDG
jgi:hypothetical protein